MSSSDGSDDEGPPLKRQKGSGPTTFLSWNANGLVSRCVHNNRELAKMVHETDPDVMCIQEVRIKALNSGDQGTPHTTDYKLVEDTMESTIFHKYQKHWSLADRKYSGTLTFVHKRVQHNSNDVAFTTQSALSMLLKKYNLTREDIGLSASPVKKQKEPAKKQTSMKSFFAPKGKTNNAAGSSSVKFASHQLDGRFQFLSFPNFDLINTYQPNNGTKQESFQRRRDWDRDMKELLKYRLKILKKVASSTADKSAGERPLIWCGDMNVAKEYRDGTHWEQREPGKGNDSEGKGIYEWWRDEKKCLSNGLGKKVDPSRHPDDKGIPSFTTNERKRFIDILETADLDDVWRTLHPNGIEADSEEPKKRTFKTEWDKPNWTWRGHLSNNGNTFSSKYEGKGQRLDYFLLSPSTLTSQVVLECDILGYGVDRQGHFCGSDHSSIILRLKRPL
ncbi:Endonuclease/Exonuclease/phosphatase family [Seminavis robusta]|uniref:Endonuclease/Exonuclease/phosphatase family n=1 Tax=Seminavis robusta TaxID=568900 RepID=A0A9N8EAR8_9STRA|nr:Endonuclease/Exonuclease/phosphatase family [Seminavis robusta]|eukprot:Sro695_g188790.1 Endonuclease/Exonuclease/phosphatase family (447) ;mRNA; f:46889-48369